MNEVIVNAAIAYAQAVVDWHSARVGLTVAPANDYGVEVDERMAWARMCEAQEWLNTLAREEALKSF